MRHCLLFCAPLLLALPLVALSGDAPKLESPKPLGSVGRTVNFTLKDTSAKDWSLGDIKNKKAVVVIFFGTECTITNAYMPRLAELYKTYAEKGVAFVAINSNNQDTV